MKAKSVWKYHRCVSAFTSCSVHVVLSSSFVERKHSDIFVLSCYRVSGYLLFPMFLMTAAVGGNYSSWVAANVNVGVRILVYTLAPIFALVAIWSRARLSKMNFRPS